MSVVKFSPVVCGRFVICQFRRGTLESARSSLDCIKIFLGAQATANTKVYPKNTVSHTNPKRPPSRWVNPGGVKLTSKPKLGLPMSSREGVPQISRVLPESHVISSQGGDNPDF